MAAERIMSERIMRVTHREREDTVEALRAAYTAGCLDDAELEGRTSQAYAAKTRGEVDDLVSDLPPIPPGEMPAERPPWPADRGWPGWARECLSWSCWLMLAAVGSWLIDVMARGAAAVLMIFLWLVSLRLCGLLFKYVLSMRTDAGGQFPVPPGRLPD